MQSQDLLKYKLPDEPGVYRFFKGGQILYIGKATSLRDRVRSYFNGDLGDTRGPRLVKMLSEANHLTWQPTGSVLEALILESALIKKNQPTYNAREKDDKSYNYVVITRERFPRVLVKRGKDLLSGKKSRLTQNVRSRTSHKLGEGPIDIKYQFGPFPSGRDLKIALRLIRKIFPFRDFCVPSDRLSLGCFNYQLGLCPGVCAGVVSVSEYGKIISRLRMFFSGQLVTLRSRLQREMKNYAKKQEFEKAGEIKKQLFSLDHIQDISLLTADKKDNQSLNLRFEAYDIAHLSGFDTVGSMVVWQDEQLQPSAYRRFEIKRLPAGQVDDLKNLAEILKRRLSHSEWPQPEILIVDGDERARQVAEKIIDQAKWSTKVIAVTKDRHHKAAKLLGDSRLIHDYHQIIITTNAEAHRFALAYHRQKRAKRFSA